MTISLFGKMGLCNLFTMESALASSYYMGEKMANRSISDIKTFPYFHQIGQISVGYPDNKAS